MCVVWLREKKSDTPKRQIILQSGFFINANTMCLPHMAAHHMTGCSRYPFRFISERKKMTHCLLILLRILITSFFFNLRLSFSTRYSIIFSLYLTHDILLMNLFDISNTLRFCCVKYILWWDEFVLYHKMANISVLNSVERKFSLRDKLFFGNVHAQKLLCVFDFLMIVNT